MTNFADIRSRKKGVTTAAIIQLDGSVAAELQRLQSEYQDALVTEKTQQHPDFGTVPKSTLILKEIGKLAEKAEETRQVFTFRSLGRPAQEALVREFPPTPEQLAEAKANNEPRPQFNIDLFPPALIADASLDPKISREEALEIWNDPDWNDAELTKLYQAARDANNTEAAVPFTRSVIAGMRTLPSNSTTAPQEESPTASS